METKLLAIGWFVKEDGLEVARGISIASDFLAPPPAINLSFPNLEKSLKSPRPPPSFDLEETGELAAAAERPSNESFSFSLPKMPIRIAESQQLKECLSLPKFITTLLPSLVGSVKCIKNKSTNAVVSPITLCNYYFEKLQYHRVLLLSKA